ncbi:MAG: hypothetical protein ABII16_00995 [Patescibacteria group bacterium]
MVLPTEMLTGGGEMVEMVLPEGAKEIYAAAAEQTDYSVSFYRRPAGRDRLFRQKWEPMVRIVSKPGTFDFTPFWDQVDAIETAAAEQQA